MKKSFFIFGLFFTILISSCTSHDVKEISGTLLFNEIGSHSFNINAENILATITIASPNKEEIIVHKDVPLYRTVDYTAKINDKNTQTPKIELLSNLVVLYEANSNTKQNNIHGNGYIKIEWKGIY